MEGKDGLKEPKVEINLNSVRGAVSVSRPALKSSLNNPLS